MTDAEAFRAMIDYDLLVLQEPKLEFVEAKIRDRAHPRLREAYQNDKYEANRRVIERAVQLIKAEREQNKTIT